MLYLVTGIWKLTGHEATVPIRAESEDRARFAAEWGGLIPTRIVPQTEPQETEDTSAEPPAPEQFEG